MSKAFDNTSIYEKSSFESVSRHFSFLGPRLMKVFFSSKFLLVLFACSIFIPPIVFAQETSSLVSQSDPSPRKIDAVYDLRGRLFSQTDLFSDRYNGFYRTFHPNGQLATELRYKDGWEVLDKAFDTRGWSILREATVRSFYADGTLASQGEYRHDLKQGEYKYFYYDGKTVVDIWHYMDGRRVGAHIRNDSSGKFQFQEDWGYPTSYIRKLQNIIAVILLAFVVVLFLWWINLCSRGHGDHDDHSI